MAWVRLDDGFPDHPKIAVAGPLAGWLFVYGLAYANRHLTDGFVPHAVAHFAFDPDWVGEDSCQPVAESLVKHGLWHNAEGGYQIHDYLDYQPSRAKVQEEREQAKNRMTRSREVRAKFKDPDPKPVPKEQEQHLATAPPLELVKPAKERKPRAPDPLWDVLVEVFGAEAAGLERGRWNKALASIREAGGTPEQLRAAAVAYREHEMFGRLTMTPTAIASNWTLLTAAPKTEIDFRNERLLAYIAEQQKGAQA